MTEQSLTIVFSSRVDNPEFISHLKKTCGIETAEILQFINKGEHSLTEVYNRGLEEARNDIIVFSHDDVIFDQSDNWGQKILHHFQSSNFGILGKAGTTCITESGEWWALPHLMVGHMWHRITDPKTGEAVTLENRYSGNFGEKIIETAIVDGLFFAVNRERIKKRFDENIKGFHFYDIDFCLANHFEGVKVGVIFDMKIGHKSPGMTDKQWEANRNFFIQKWKPHLPYSMKPEILYEQFDIAVPEQPKLAIIIPVKDNMSSLPECMNTISERTKYRNYRIYIANAALKADNPEVLQNYLRRRNDIAMIEYPSYHFPGMVNDMVRKHVAPDTELLLFCNQDIRLLNDAISRCVQVYSDNKEEIGTIGIRLHSDDKTVFHAGLHIYIDEHDFLRITLKGYKSYYSYNPGVKRDTLGNAEEFMMVGKDLFLSLGGFPENYAEYLEDVEFNLRSIISGKVNYFVGDAVAVYSEPYPDDEDPEIVKRKFMDYQNLLAFIQKNAGNRRIAFRIRKSSI